MKAITLRNLPPDVARAVLGAAAEKGISLNRAVIALLEQAGGAGRAKRPPREHRDLDAFFGVWSKRDAEEFGRHLVDQRPVDPEIWT